MSISVSLDKRSDTPLYRQLGDALLELIVRGKLAPETKLPPIRQMAQLLDVNNTTVVSAYKYLERLRAVYSVVGSGTYVARPVANPAMPEVELGFPAMADDFINFTDTAIDSALFPVAAFKRAFNTVLDRDGTTAFDCHDSQGHEAFRESLCQLLEGLGVNVLPDQLHIISNVQQGLDILAGALLEPGDAVFVERPASQSIAAAFRSRQAHVIEMPLAKDGPDFSALEGLVKKRRPKLIYVMPNFQQPSGMCYSAESKRRLLELAHACDAYIIEEDQFSDLYFDGNKKNPLKALDSHRVIYIRSFSRILATGFRMGFMACPSRVVALVRGNRELAVPGYFQRAFDVFLRCGDYEAHAANLRHEYGRRYQKIVGAVNTYLAGLADYDLPGGGLGLWIRPRRANNDAEDYAGGFLKRKVIVSPGRLYSADGDMSGFRISFASVPEERIAGGIGIIASVLAER